MERQVRMDGDSHPLRVVDEDGATVEVFALPTDAASLEELLREVKAVESEQAPAPTTLS